MPVAIDLSGDDRLTGIGEQPVHLDHMTCCCGEVSHFAIFLLNLISSNYRLPGFLRSYQVFAADAARNDEDHVRYLLALAEQEVREREQNMQRERVKQARCPVLRELADFDFSAVPSLNKAYVLDLARGDYIARREPVIFIGNPGLGKTHLALGLALAACRQGRKVRFWTAAGLVDELQQAQDEHRLSRFSTAALKLDLLVLDELGFIPFSPAAAQLLFTFYSELHERVAVIVTSNLKFGTGFRSSGRSGSRRPCSTG